MPRPRSRRPARRARPSPQERKLTAIEKVVSHLGSGLGNDIREEAFVRGCLQQAARATREVARTRLPKGTSRKGSDADLFSALAREGLIGKRLSARLSALDALERLVASGYELGNLRVVKNALDEHLEVFQRFVDAVRNHGRA